MPEILEYATVHLQRQDLHDRAPLTRPATPSARATGIHLSGILRYLVRESGLIRYQDQLDEEDLPLRMALGIAWEEFAASLYHDVLWQPGEVCESDIYMNCDGLSQVPGGIRVEEFKLSWRKSKTAEELLSEEWYWLQQIRGYCWGYNAREVRLHACWINGDYRGSGPLYNRYTLRFKDSEVDTTRSMLLANLPRAIEKGYAEL